MGDIYRYVVGAELPSIGLNWRDSNNQVIDFSVAGYTWQLRMNTTPDVFEKTTGIIGAAAEPNVTITWDVDELASIAPGIYTCQLRARDASNKDQFKTFSIEFVAAI